MKRISASILILLAASISGCNQHDTSLTGKACLSSTNDALVENMEKQCKAGDMVATKHPAYFCDFTYTVAYNDYNSAYCVYNGSQREERIADPAK